MQLHTLIFPGSRESDMERCLRVLERSAAENSPSTPHITHRINAADEDVVAAARHGCRATYIDNARKAKHQNRIVQEAADGEVLCFLDADTLVLGDLSEVESVYFDIAYTVRPKVENAASHWKLNTGVYFVRVSFGLKLFMDLWVSAVLRMLANEEFHNEWKNNRKYGGTQQAAFGWMIENSRLGLKLLPLPCETWNVVPSCVELARDPKVVHIMSSTRQCCLGRRKPTGAKLIEFVGKWSFFDGQRV